MLPGGQWSQGAEGPNFETDASSPRSRDFDFRDSSLSQFQLLCLVMALSNFRNFSWTVSRALAPGMCGRRRRSHFRIPMCNADAKGRTCEFDIIWWPFLAFWFWLWIFEARWQDKAKKCQERIPNITCYAANCKFPSLNVSGTLTRAGEHRRGYTAFVSVACLIFFCMIEGTGNFACSWNLSDVLRLLSIIGSSFQFSTPLYC